MPIGSIISPTNKTSLNGNATIISTVSDNIGIAYASLQYMNSTTAWTNFSGCNAMMGTYNCVWNTALFSNSIEGYDVKIVPCDLLGNCNTTTPIYHYYIDRNAPYGTSTVIYPTGQSSISNGQTLWLKLNLTDGAGAGMNNTGIFSDLTKLNGTGNSSMKIESGTGTSGTWTVYNISVNLLNSITGLPTSVLYYARDGATPTNNLMSSTYLVYIDDNAPTYDGLQLTPPGVIYNSTIVTFTVNGYDNYNLTKAIFSSNVTGIWINDTIISDDMLSSSFSIDKNVTTGTPCQ